MLIIVGILNLFDRKKALMLYPFGTQIRMICTPDLGRVT